MTALLLSRESEEIAAVLLDLALKSFLPLALGLVAARGMRDFSAAARHFVLALAVGSLLVLPLFAALLPEWRVLPRWMDVSAVAIAREAQEPWIAAFDPNSIAARPAAHARHEAEIPASPLNSAPSAHAEFSEQARWSPSQWAAAVWAIGALCASLPTVFGLFSLGRLTRQARRLECGRSLRLLQELAATVRCRRRIILLQSAERAMPMTWGILFPKILLPEESCDWPEERRRVVLLHELGHVQRRDYFINLGTRIACALYWFNPLVWLLARQMRTEREQACDDLVVNAGASPTNYAEEILHIAARPAVSCFQTCTAIAMARPSRLEERLRAILDHTRNRRLLTPFSMTSAWVLLVAVIIPVAMLRSETRPPANTDGLVAWWQAEGNADDRTGAHAGQATFGSRYGRGVIGQAFDFTRSYAIAQLLQRVSVADSKAFEFTDAMTLEAWIYPRSYGGIILLRGDDRAGFDNWQLDLMNENLSFYFNAADGRGTGVGAHIPLGQWQHVVATFDRGAMKLHVNGVLVAQGQTDLRPITALDASYDPAIGIGNAGGHFYNMPFDGLIDEVRIYNRALTDAEIAASVAR